MYYYCLFQSPIFADYERATYFPLFCGSGATRACFSRTSDILWEDNIDGGIIWKAMKEKTFLYLAFFIEILPLFLWHRLEASCLFLGEDLFVLGEMVCFDVEFSAWLAGSN